MSFRDGWTLITLHRLSPYKSTQSSALSTMTLPPSSLLPKSHNN